MTRTTKERGRRAGFSRALRGRSRGARLQGRTCSVPGKPARGNVPVFGARGFTLIEVLVALAIVTIGMAAVLEALTSSANTTVYLRDKTFAEWVALNQFERSRLRSRIAGQVPPTGTSTGHVRNAGRRWHWRQRVRKTLVPGVERVVVDVRPAKGHGKEWYASVTGYVGDKIAAPNPAVPSWRQGLGDIPPPPTNGQPPSTSGSPPGQNSSSLIGGAGGTSTGSSSGSSTPP